MTCLIHKNEIVCSSTLNHIRKSKSLILQGLENCDAGDVLILGGGKCTEIPVLELSEKSNKIDMVELNHDSVFFVKNSYKVGTLNCYHTDLTGMIDQVRSSIIQILPFLDDPNSCSEAFAYLLSNLKPDFWYPVNSGRYQIVVASCVLTQLQAYVRKELEQAFLQKFPDALQVLLSNKTWLTGCKMFAADLEIKFIKYLNSLVEKGGIIYLSDTIKVSWLNESDKDGYFFTDGYWLTIDKEHLTDYLSLNNSVHTEERWKWARLEKEGNFRGRLYDVQAILYQVN